MSSLKIDTSSINTPRSESEVEEIKQMTEDIKIEVENLEAKDQDEEKGETKV